MIGVIMFLNSRGDIVVSRTFRDGFNVRGLGEMFRNCFISTNVVNRNPINIVDGLCFVHVRFQDLYLVLVSDQNANCFLCIQYAMQLLDICYAYFDTITEETLKENFVALLQIIDETMDFGYPQFTDVRVLKSYITTNGVNDNVIKQPKEAEKATRMAMGRTPWRSPDCLYRVNELFVDVLEEINVLVSQTGHVLENSAIGQVIVRNFLSGMPECRLVLNDDFSLEDTFLHPCVRCHQDRVLNFVPVDGIFLLMRYRTAIPSPPPLMVRNARVVDVSKTRTEIEFALKCEVPEGKICDEAEVRVPCPENAADVKILVSSGKAYFDGVRHAIIWSLPSLGRGAEVTLSAEIVLLAPTLSSSVRFSSRLPIKIYFKVPSHALSGFSVRELKVEEPDMRYTPQKWVRYATKSGQYECRI